MAQGTEYISSLVEYTVGSDMVKPDLEACLEIADRVNGNKLEQRIQSYLISIRAVECIKAIIKQLGRIVGNSLQKCQYEIHYGTQQQKASGDPSKASYKGMKERNAILNFRDEIERNMEKKHHKLQTRINWRYYKEFKSHFQSEEKILYLMQLWADTFMMHEDEYKYIHEGYRLLRKEGSTPVAYYQLLGVKFPDRDPNMKYMINFSGVISPVFLAMEKNFIAPSNNQGGAPMDPRKKEKPVVHQPEYRHEYEPKEVQNTLYNDEEEEEEEEYEGVEISEEEIKILEESLNILKEIELNATKPGDMKTEIAREILGDLVHVKKRIGKIIQTDQLTHYQYKELNRIKEKITEHLISFKERYTLIKENSKNGIATEPLVKQPEVKTQVNKNISEDFLSDKKEEQKHNEESKKPDLKNPMKKLGKLAPPKGWKNPAVSTQTQDLVNLLDDPQPKVEEKPKNPTNVLEDLLGVPLAQPSKVIPQQQSSIIVNPSNPQAVENNEVNNTPNKTGSDQNGHNGTGVDTQKKTSNPQVMQIALTFKRPEDDDFFSDLANRK